MPLTPFRALACPRPAALPSAALALALAAGASAQTVTILEPAAPNTYSRAHAVWGNTQGGSRDNGYSVPRLWQGTAASGTTLAEPSVDAGSRVNGLTATKAVGECYVRTSDTDGYYAALLWDLPSGAVTVIGPPPGFGAAYGYGVGGNQQVGAVEDTNVGGSAPALWTGSTASFVNLLPAGYDYGRAYGTDGTQQVGYVYNPAEDDDRAALWTGTAGSFVNLHSGPTGSGSVAYAVGGGRQVGRRYIDSISHACVWQGTAASFVDIHPVLIPAVVESEATGVSGNVICGTAEVVGENRPDHAVLWLTPSASSFVDLHSLLPPGYAESEANAVWTDGTVVRVAGSAEPADEDLGDVAVLWTITSTAGTCCVGQSCAQVASVAACAAMGGAMGTLGGTCGPMTCCAAPMGTPASADCDGDLLLDRCTALAPQADCNAAGGPDSCETLSTTGPEPFVFEPGPWVFNGAAFVDFRTAVLTPAEGGVQGAITLDPLTAGPTRRVRAVFDFRMTPVDGVPRGDGFSFAIMDASVHGPNASFGEDGANAGSLSIKFNTYANTPQEGSNSMFVRWHGADVAQNLSLPFTLADGRWHRCTVDVTAGGQVTVRVGTNPGDMATVFNAVQVPGYAPFRARFGFGARTGAAYEQHEIRAVRIGVPAPGDANADGSPDSCAPACVADFNAQNGVDLLDIFAFLNAWFGGCTAPGPAPCVKSADVNGQNGVDLLDIFFFLNHWFAGC